VNSKIPDFTVKDHLILLEGVIYQLPLEDIIMKVNGRKINIMAKEL